MCMRVYVCVRGWGDSWTSLLARNLILNSDAAPSYKYIFGPHKVLNLICETSQWNAFNQKHCQMKQSKGLNGDLKPEDKKTTNRSRRVRPQTLIVRHRPSETDWEGSRHFVLRLVYFDYLFMCIKTVKWAANSVDLIRRRNVCSCLSTPLFQVNAVVLRDTNGK